MPRISADQIFQHDLARYFAASLVALAIDVAILSLCLRQLHFGLALSASIGFVAGAIVAYVLSIRWVFRRRAYRDVPALEFLTFIGIGVAGLGVTQLVLWLGVTQFRLLPELVKVGAAGLTFAFNYIVRKSLLFAAARRAGNLDKDPT
jgi:putative flippase GtrA